MTKSSIDELKDALKHCTILGFLWILVGLLILLAMVAVIFAFIRCAQGSLFLGFLCLCGGCVSGLLGFLCGVIATWYYDEYTW